MTESYKAKWYARKFADHTRRVVAQPTQQSDVKVKVDKASPSGISQDKRK